MIQNSSPLLFWVLRRSKLKNHRQSTPMQDLFRGKNTLEAVHALSREFVGLFGENWGVESEIAKKLLPRGKASTWSALDRNINRFCKQFYENYTEDQDKIDFLDTVRFMLAELPMRRDYKPNEDKEQNSSPQFVAQFFTTCSLCWRSVLRKPLEKKTPLCHIHDLPSQSPAYRKRVRTKPRVEAIRLELIKSLPPLFHLKKEMGEELNAYVQSLCLNQAGSLPQLAKYLHSLDMPLTDGKDIVRALEHPIYLQKVSQIVRQAWEYYLDDRGEHFRLNYIKILTAEAWLRAEKERRHGGKRR